MRIGYLDDDNLAIITRTIDKYSKKNHHSFEELAFKNIQTPSDDLGLFIIKKYKFDLLFLDINLFKEKEDGKKINGLELAVLYKNTNPNMDIVFVTSHPEYQIKHDGQFEIIRKPTNPSETDEIIDKIKKYKAVSEHRKETLAMFDISLKSEATTTIMDRIEGNSFSMLTDDKIDRLIHLVEEVKNNGIS